MKAFLLRSSIGLVVSLGILLAETAWAQYQPFALLPRQEGSRRQRVELFANVGYWHSDDIMFEGVRVPTVDGDFITSDITMGLDDTATFSFGLGWAINDHFNVHGEFDFGSADYEARWQDSYLRGELWMSSGRLNVDYNVLAGPVTPFVTAGVGYYYYDTGIPTGPPDYYCWWDYWWGYVCTGYVETYSEIDFAANAGGGLRWDISDTFFLKLLGRVTWADMGRGADWPHFLQIGVTFGGKF